FLKPKKKNLREFLLGRTIGFFASNYYCTTTTRNRRQHPLSSLFFGGRNAVL
ncbi:MAG: hypothetical protein ACI8RD_006096, partial [Bacillariaceae sp.]